MLNKQELIQNITVWILYVALILAALTPMAFARSYEPDIYDLWSTSQEFEKVSSLRTFLLEKDWINENVSINELDYILVLTQQCSKEFFPSIPTPLVLAVISVESGFNKDLTGFSNDTGLMQIIPKYHRDRIDRYLYDENVDLYDPRVNIMVGMDYLQEIIDWAEGDFEKTLMAYNMGYSRADRLSSIGHTSNYAKEVLRRMNEISSFLERREPFVCDGG